MKDSEFLKMLADSEEGKVADRLRNIAETVEMFERTSEILGPGLRQMLGNDAPLPMPFAEPDEDEV